MPPPPPNRPPVRRPGGAPPPPSRSDTEPSQAAIDPQELSVSGRRRVARRPKEAPPKKSKAPALLAVVLVLGAVGAGYWKLNQKPPPPPPKADPRPGELLAMFQDGKNLVRKGQWVEARARFAAIVEEQPDFEHGSVKTYLGAAEKEIPNQKHFEEASAALDKSEVGTAHRALSAVSPDTQQLPRRDDLQTRLADAFKQRILEGEALAGAPSDLAKMKKLRALADDLLVARPEDRDALELKATADRALRPRNEHAVELPRDDPGLKVQQLFASGDSGGALAAASACAAEAESCKALEQKLADLNGLLKRIEVIGLSELDNAQRLERAISGGKPTPQGRPLATRIAAGYYAKASAARVKGDWPLTMQYALRVIDADPGHAGGQAIVAEGKEKARDLYLRCYTQKAAAPDDALLLCNEAVKMLPPGDPTREKAERLLEGLRAK